LKLVDYAWNIVTSIGNRDHTTLRLLLDEDYDYPVLSGDRQGFVLKIPLPRTSEEGFNVLHGMYFDPDEYSWSNLWRLFKASLYHQALHAAHSNFKQYSEWAKGKDAKTAVFSVSLVEDLWSAIRGAEAWPGIMGDIAFANYFSALRVPDVNSIESPQLRFSTKLMLSSWGVWRRGREEEEDREVELLSARLRKLVADAAASNDRRILVDAAQSVYSSVASHGLLREVPFMPYTESHGECEIFDSKIVGHDSRQGLLSSAQRALQVANPEEESRVAANEAREFLQLFRDTELKLGQLKQKYEEAISSTRLEAVEFPKGDYGTFMRVRSSLAGPIRNVRDQLKLIRNVLDETGGHESGQIDTQAAMQVIASGEMRSDIFVREEPVHKDEAWAILVDASKSTTDFAHEVKGITTCLAEVARELIPVQSQWGLFCFNNSLQILKDFSEEYSTECKARIGGIVQRNATLLPDAMQACSAALAAIPVDIRILVVASDGYPTGYQGIEQNLVSTIKSISRSGVMLMGVGIDSHAIEEYFTVNCVVSSPFQMMKSFVKSYLELSSLF
jgi:hypothetical protein